MLRSSLSQAPRSMSRHRSLQNGRKGETLDHSRSRPQVGHLTSGFATLEPCLKSDQVQQISVKGTS
jgi:hypothetical protein